ncbi:E3 ubiquitin-protein ligase FANCL-like isoform X2 [Asterias amurensis]|uniref:E3 ubiquitin-protein ligase FANCL-like isoform X2 n=1 Tax=Asterias amurensis TaxID=7602 RepID=UPI003AB7EF5E
MNCLPGKMATKQNQKVFEICPSLIPLNKQQTCWEGFITIKGLDMHLRIEIPEDGDHTRAKLLGDWQLNQYLHSQQISKRLKNTPDLSTFLSELKHIMELTMQHRYDGQKERTSMTMSTQCSQVMQDINQLGWEKLSYVDPSFRRLELTSRGDNGRDHCITVHMDPQHPVVAPNCTTDLPGDAFELHWTRKSSLSDIYKQFEGCLEKYKDFWDTVGEIDEQTWVLEPEKPRPSDTARRIALGNNSSIQVTLDPLYPKMLPKFRFLGADHVINPLREKLNSNLNDWNTSRSLLSNLKSVLNVEFPSPSSSRKEDFSEECAICLSYHLEGAIPERACDSPQCNKPFHYNCLYEWLRSSSSSHQTNTIFGECPYCSKPIKIKKNDSR